MAFFTTRKRGRRRFLMTLLGLAVSVPLGRLARVPRVGLQEVGAQEFVRRDGWILRKDDLS